MQPRAKWTCDNNEWRSDVPVVWLRFEAGSWQGRELPQYFFSRIARFTSITFHAIDADGETRTRRLSQADGSAFPSGPVFQMPLPEITADTTLVLARIEAPHSVPLLTEALFAPSPDAYLAEPGQSAAQLCQLPALRFWAQQQGCQLSIVDPLIFMGLSPRLPQAVAQLQQLAKAKADE